MANQLYTYLSQLERLPPELLHIILSSTSLDDLYAFIRASPTLYAVFRQTKASTLLKVCANDLGPAIRDVIIASSEHAPADEIVAAWKARLLSEEDRWLAGILTNEPLAIRIVHINRVTQDFVDLYARSRVVYFKKRLTGEGCDSVWSYQRPTRQAQDTDAWGCLSLTERWNLSQAIVRRQAIVGMYRLVPGSPLPGDSTDIPAIDSLQGLFEPWEKEQIAQIDNFFYELCQILFYCDGTSRKYFPRRFNGQQASHTFLPGGFITAESFCHEYYPRLPALRQRITQAAAADPEIIDRVLGFHPFDRFFREERLTSKILHTNFQKRSILPPSNHRVPCKIAPKSPVEAPWGWVHAVGLDGARWGDELIVKPPVSTDWPTLCLYWRNEEKIKSWRWAGFAFWDERRAKSLHRHRDLLDHSDDRSIEDTPGWLARLCE